MGTLTIAKNFTPIEEYWECNNKSELYTMMIKNLEDVYNAHEINFQILGEVKIAEELMLAKEDDNYRAISDAFIGICDISHCLPFEFDDSKDYYPIAEIVFKYCKLVFAAKKLEVTLSEY